MIHINISKFEVKKKELFFGGGGEHVFNENRVEVPVR